MYTESKFEQAGRLSTKQTRWSDEELDLVISKLKNTIDFLSDRGDSDVIVSRLRIELYCFEDKQKARKTL